MPNKFISNIWFRATTLRNGKLPDSMCVRFVRPNESDNHFVCRSAWRWNALTRHIRLLFTCASTIDASPSSPHTVGVFFCSYTLSSFCRPSINVLFSFECFVSINIGDMELWRKKDDRRNKEQRAAGRKKNNQNKRIAHPNKTIVLLNICATWGNLFRFFLGGSNKLSISLSLKRANAVKPRNGMRCKMFDCHNLCAFHEREKIRRKTHKPERARQRRK